MTETPPARLPDYRSPRGTALSCKGWQQEAALRLLMNSVDPELAENSKNLLICEGQKAARDWESFQNIAAELRNLDQNELLLIESGVPEGIYVTQPGDPIMIQIGAESGQEGFDRFRRSSNLLGLAQVCAANWIFVGCQIALQPAYEILAAAARKHFDGTLAGKLVVASGLGAVGGAQPLAAAMHGAAALGIEADAETLKQRVKSNYCDVMVNDLDEALRILKNAVRKREPAAVGLLGKPGDTVLVLAKRGIVPDLFFPNLHSQLHTDSVTSDETNAVSQLEKLGTVVLDGETFHPSAAMGEDSEPLIYIALSGNAADVARADRLLLNLFPDNSDLATWIALANKHVRFQGLPARVAWLSPAERLTFAAEINKLVALVEFQAPLALGGIFAPYGFGQAARPSLEDEALSVALPVTPQFRGRRDASSSTLLLIALSLLNAAGLSWAAVEAVAADGESGLGVRLVGGSIVADGTAEAAARTKRVLARDAEK